MAGPVDGKDFRLLVALSEDARQSLQALGRKVSLSAPAVRDRLRHLESRAILQGYWVSFDPAIFGRENLLVSFRGEWSREEAVHALGAPEVAWVAWKVEGGVTVQVWPKDAKSALRDVSRFVGRQPRWHGTSSSGWSGTLKRPDWRLLDALIDEPLASVRTLGGTVRLSPKTVRRRLASLTGSEAIYIVARLGYAMDSGDLVYDLAVSGTPTFAEVHRAVGDAMLIHETQEPARMYIMCRSPSLGDLTAATRRVEKVSGVTDVQVSLNRELLIAKDFHHALVQEAARAP